jgi:RNA polymerase sigma-70 factor (ECF subfamily)
LLTEVEFAEIYRKETGPLYAYVSRRVGGDRSLAEDVVQDTWLRAVASWRRRSTPDHPRAWLIRVAHNLLVSHFRRRRPQLVDPVELELAEGRCNPETPSAAALVNWGMARLSRRQAVLLEAFYFENRSTREIAQTFGLSERAVEGRLRRARQNLEKHLRPYVSPDAPADSIPESATVLELSEGRRKNA